MQYAKTFDFMPAQQESGTILLRPEQIHVETAPPPHAQNAIIRLSESIRKYGILEPLTVARKEGHPAEPSQYTLISGFKRFAAARLAKIDRIPCQILPNNDRFCAISSVLRNIKQTDLHFFEQAAAFRLLIQDFSMTQEEIAKSIGISQSAVANKLRLLAFSKEEQLKIIDYGATERHARALLRLKSPQERGIVLQRIRAERLSVAATEALIDEQLSAAPNKPRKPQEAPPCPTRRIEMAKAAESSNFCPTRFAMQSPQPLYNSIERLVSIFRKTGAAASCYREEGAESIRIVIEIPQKA